MRSSYIKLLIALVIFVTISCVVTTIWLLQQNNLCGIFNKTNESPEQSDLIKKVETVTVLAEKNSKSLTSSSAKITSQKPTLVYKQMGSYKIPDFKGAPETAVKREKVKEVNFPAIKTTIILFYDLCTNYTKNNFDR